MEVYAIIAFVIAIIILIITWLITQYNKFSWQKIKLNKGEINLVSLFEKKYQLFNRMLDFLKENTKNEIKDLETIKFDKGDLHKINKKIEEQNNIINSYIDENEKIIKNATFKKLYQELNDLNAAITGSKKYYNNNLMTYNHLCHAFPSKIISKIFKYHEKTFLDEETHHDLKILNEQKEESNE